MNKKWLKRVLAPLFVLLALFGAVSELPAGQRAAGAYVNETTTVKIGLYYGENVLSSANLQNYVGSGFVFGYFDPEREFHDVGETDETRITMLKDWTMYQAGNLYYDEVPNSHYDVIGCYHVRLKDSYGEFAAAKEAAAAYSDAFPAYHNGTWYVCVGSYASQASAETALYERGLSGTAMTASSRCVTVVATGTAKILFQFDCGSSASLAVRPKADESGEKPQTWFKGYKYYGAFQYTRLDGEDLTVVNVLDLEDYIKGVVPYEMSTSWPLEALKAQAVCARTYAAAHVNAHRSGGFDLCNSTHCQAYGGTNRAGEGSDRAVEETAGVYVTYQDELCEVFYFSSDGGATENSENVFNEAIPYLRGVVDPYEQYVSTGKARWSYTYTSADITRILQLKGYNCASIVSITPTYTDMGNIYSLKFTDANGRNWSFSRYNASSILYSPTVGKYTYSMRFTVNPAGKVEDLSVYVNEPNSMLEELGEVYVIGGSGEAEAITFAEPVTVLTAEGMETVVPGHGTGTIRADSYVISGSGWGHNVGMSQFGAKAMAEQGIGYEEILKFYFTGVDIG